ncbi:MAG: hypothetical protein Q4G05_04290 [Clostridia bacterium]|nr:hypothetical protein [Clostridia bacterium]
MIKQASNLQFLPVISNLPADILKIADKVTEGHVNDIVYLREGALKYPYNSLNIQQAYYLEIVYYNITNLIYEKLLYSEDEYYVDFKISAYNDYFRVDASIGQRTQILEIIKHPNDITIYINFSHSFEVKEVLIKLLKLIGADKMMGERNFKKIINLDLLKYNDSLVSFEIK